MKKKELFVSSFPMVEINDSSNIPTVLFYKSKSEYFIGNEAINNADDIEKINQDFKVDLGYVSSDKTFQNRNYITAIGGKRSASGLTSDFLSKLIKSCENWLNENNIPPAKNIIIAEPISINGMEVELEWLSKYRKNIRDILEVQGFERDRIDFLPEPFAVFQYYRYGLKHPLIASEKKQCVLVIDFGGGTFDTSVIETRNDGDLKEGAKNSKPLAARSITIGGFFINQMIALQLLKNNIKSFDKSKINIGYDEYVKWRKNNSDLSRLKTDIQNFIHNFSTLVYKVENLKLALSRTIYEWNLDSKYEVRVSTSIPSNPFLMDSPILNVTFSSTEFLQVFENKIWKSYLRQTIKETLKRAEELLEGQKITLILMSGGSSNILWLQKLLERDFETELGKAQLIKIDDFQTVVAKGLAIECTRRFHNQDGDFVATTYNNLCLLLGSEDIGLEPRIFKSLEKEIPDSRTPGVLLPSASALSRFIDVPLNWKVHLEKSPKHHLNYFFMRSSLDTSDLENLQNIIETKVDTPKNCNFDSNTKIQLLIGEDGTARPRFIYKQGKNDQETSFVDGNPFYLDMTFAQKQIDSDSYIGLDFGTTNTSISYISKNNVQIFETRAEDAVWKRVNELVELLPYPIANPLGKYLSLTDMSKSFDYFRRYFEASLAMAAYIVYLDYCSIKGKAVTKYFKGLPQMSAGPLWHFLQMILRDHGTQLNFANGYRQLLSLEFFEKFDKIVTFISNIKHDKSDEQDIMQIIKMFANLSYAVFQENIFGVFENVKKMRFANNSNGIFRAMHGNPPFCKLYKYEGTESFADYDCYLINKNTSKALPLSPFLFWDLCAVHKDQDNYHCFMYDINERNNESFNFKSVGYSCQKSVDKEHFMPLYDVLFAMKEYDQKIELISIGNLIELNSEND